VEFLDCGEECQCEVPQLVFLEESGTEALSVVDFVAEDEWIIVEEDLYRGRSTLTTPAEPQKPDLLKECSMGRSKA
jgi:hypothetical protein